MIVVSIAEKTPEKLLETANLAKKEGAETVEARLDFLESFGGLEEALKRIELPVIVTCRPEREGGNYKGSEYERIELLKKVSEIAEFVDIEYDTAPAMMQEVRRAAAANGAVLIVSKHYAEMPSESELEKTYTQAKVWGDAVKIVPKTKSIEENKRLMKFLSGKKDLIAFASGEKGKVTRVVAEKLGSLFTYCCLGEPVAEGQMQVKELKSAKKKMPKEFSLEKIRV